MNDADILSTKQAAEELVHLGILAEVPEHSTMCRWARQGLFVGARKLNTGPSSPWLIPRAAVISFQPPKLGPPFKQTAEVCGCVLPEQSCPICEAAGRKSAGPLEDIF